MIKKVLVTGFEPFSQFKSNPTSKVATNLDGLEEGGLQYFGRVLDVSYETVERSLRNHLEEIKPDLVIGTGLAPGRSRISIEKIAINYMNSSEPDNNGITFRGKTIDPDEQDGLFTRLKAEYLVEKLNSHGIPTEISFSAGAYLCNMAMFLILRECKRLGIPGGFIHLPCDSELAASLVKSYPSMNINTMIEGVKIVARVGTEEMLLSEERSR